MAAAVHAMQSYCPLPVSAKQLGQTYCIDGSGHAIPTCLSEEQQQHPLGSQAHAAPLQGASRGVNV